MTVLSTDTPYSQYTGTGERVFYEYGFEYAGDVVYVEVDGVPVAFAYQSTGVVLDTAPPLNASVIIYRKTDITQERDFTAFDAFVASWTEDALDKLILLKQEAAAYRAQTNLLANHFLERVEIENTKGSNPDIFIWNTDMSGVFAGEATSNPPLIGSYVEKPDDFVYLIWGYPYETQEYTTTLYPAEALDAIELSIDLDSAVLREVFADEIEFDVSEFVSGSKLTILLTMPQKDEEIEFEASEFVSGSKATILLTMPQKDEFIEFEASELVSASKRDLLITAYSPDEGLEMAIDLDTAITSLDPV